MATNTEQNAVNDMSKENGFHSHDHATTTAKQRKPYDYGGNPLVRTSLA